MVTKIGFITEGDTERFLLQNTDLFDLLDERGVIYHPVVINANGNGNLLPHNLTKYVDFLMSTGVNKIIILTDLDDDTCVTLTKARIGASDPCLVCVAKQQIESWYLADTEAMRKMLNDQGYICADPEMIEAPIEHLRKLNLDKNGRGVPSKLRLARFMVHQCGFSLRQAYKHPEASSVRYFIDKLR